MRWHLAFASSVTAAVLWLSLALAAPAAETARQSVSKMLADADIASADVLATAELERLQPASLDAAWWYNEKGIIEQARGHYANALTWFNRALRIRRARMGLRNTGSTTSLNNVALMEEQTGRFRDARRHFEQAFRANLALLGPRHRQTLTTLSNMGLLNLTLGHINQAQAQLQSALDATAMTEGWWSDNTATGLSNLASVHVTALRFDVAEKLLRRALSIDEYRHGATHPDVAITLNNLGELYRLQGKPVEAEQAYLRAAAIDRTALGTDSPGYAIDLLNLATLYDQTGRLNDARTSLDMALPIITSQISGHAEVTAAVLSELAHLLCKRGRCLQARPLLHAAADRISKAFGADSLAALQVNDDLAMMHATLGEQAAAARARKDYLESASAIFGPQGPVAVRARLRYAEALAADNRPAEARQAMTGLQPLIERQFGKRSLDAAHLWALRARLAATNGTPQDALRHARRSLALFRTWLSPTAPQLAQLHDLSSRVHARQGHWRQALAEGQRALRIISDRRRLAASHLRDGQADSPGDDDLVARSTMTTAIEAAHHLRTGSSALNTAFEAAEILADGNRHHAVAFGALKRRALAAGSLALVHEQALLLANMETLDTSIDDASATGAGVPAVQARRQSIRHALEGIDDRLKRTLPQYEHLMNQTRLTPREIGAQLRDGEMLLYLLPGDGSVSVLAMTKSAHVGYKADIPLAKLHDMVARLRTGLDPSQWKNSFEPFDRNSAFALYVQLLKPLEPLLRTSRTLFVVSGAPLDQLPLGVLVDAPPTGGKAGDSSPEALRTTAWLGRRFGIVQIPSASALGYLRMSDDMATPPLSFLGIGPQRFSHDQGVPRQPSLQAARSEMRSFAGQMGESRSTILLDDAATKAAFLHASPATKSVIAFATHALSSQQSGVGEAALLLSPGNSVVRVDGMLTTSEIAAMDLSADWIILSGCNTAGDGATGSRSLAEAFTLAGARSLLVSHWPVSDRSSARVTTSVVGHFRARPNEGQAEALRRAMIDTMADRSNPLNAHPSTWAAFSLVGEARSPDRANEQRISSAARGAHASSGEAPGSPVRSTTTN